MTHEPIPIHPHEPDPLQRLAHAGGLWLRRVRVQSERLQGLLRAAKTPEGRRHNVIPLMTLSCAVGALLGLGLGWASRRRQ